MFEELLYNHLTEQRETNMLLKVQQGWLEKIYNALVELLARMPNPNCCPQILAELTKIEGELQQLIDLQQSTALTAIRPVPGAATTH